MVSSGQGQTHRRIEWIDSLKGLAILLVMWGHVEKHLGILHIYNWIGTFHVPVFLVLSGMLFNEHKKTLSTYKRTRNKIIWPYLIFSIFALLTDAVLNYLENNNIESVVHITEIDTYKTLALYGIHALWYLSSYLIAVLIFLYLTLKLSKNQKIFVCIVFLILGILYSVLFEKYKVITLIAIPTGSIVRSLVCCTYIEIGYILEDFLTDTYNKNSAIFFMLILFIVSIAISVLNGESNFSIIFYGKMPLLMIIGSICASVAFPMLFKILNIHCKVLQYFGKNSLILLVTHSSLKLTVLSQFIVGNFMPDTNPMFSILCLGLLVIFEIPIIKLLNGKFNILVNNPFLLKSKSK